RDRDAGRRVGLALPAHGGERTVTGRGSALPADELDVRAPAARPDRRDRGRVRSPRTYARTPRTAGARLASRSVRTRDCTPLARGRIADSRGRRDRALLRPYDAAPPARGPRTALRAGRPHRPAPPADPRAAGGDAAARPREPARRLPHLERQPRGLAPPVLLRSRAPLEPRARARARRLLQRGHRALAASRGDAAGARVVRHRREARIHRGGPARGDHHRERVHLGRIAVLRHLPDASRLPRTLAERRSKPRRVADDARGLDR